MTVPSPDEIGHIAPQRWLTTKRSLMLSVGFISGLAIMTLAMDHFGIRINLTASLPTGLYRINPNGSLIEFCPAEPFGSLSVERGYRPSGGRCPDGGAPLLKPIVARGGDTVIIGQDGLRINGGPLVRNSKPFDRDTSGHPLAPWPFGTYRLNAGQLWVASTYNVRSFDSRYLGPIPVSAVRARLSPLCVWR